MPKHFFFTAPYTHVQQKCPLGPFHVPKHFLFTSFLHVYNWRSVPHFMPRHFFFTAPLHTIKSVPYFMPKHFLSTAPLNTIKNVPHFVTKHFLFTASLHVYNWSSVPYFIPKHFFFTATLHTTAKLLPIYAQTFSLYCPPLIKQSNVSLVLHVYSSFFTALSRTTKKCPPLCTHFKQSH